MIECIPNFSEGRRPEVVAAIRDAIRAVAGACVLDTHSDADHNRSVITFAGEAEPVAEAAFRAVEAAAVLIDMQCHTGQHPRIGATDVLPFVPLRGATLDQCAELARTVGRRIAAELAIPVYLYGAAATSAERRELPNLRRGEYEVLRQHIRDDLSRAPDFGPRQLGSAGATVVGAREPLIAYNLFLNTADVAVARQIARAVRGSSGGLRGVRALGLLVGGRAQVSMNLTDFRATPIHRAVEMVIREAANYGVLVTTGELVGLIPEDALIDAGRVRLRLPHLTNDQILERRLVEAMTEASERPNGKSLRARLYALHSEQHNSAVRQRVAPPLETQMDAIWSHSVLALAAAVGELATPQASGRVRAMLRVLARDLLNLADEERNGGPTARVQALLLMARRAVKATEVLSATATDDVATIRAAVVVHLAHSVAASARLRAMALLPLLDEHYHLPLTHEFNTYAQRTRDLLTRIDPVA